MTPFQTAVVLMLISTTLASLSSVVLKLAASKMPPMENQTLRKNLVALFTNKQWLLGFALSATAVILNWLALGRAEMSTIQPLYGFGLIVLVISAHKFLGEHITRTELLGIALAMGGVALVGFGATPAQTHITLEKLVPIYTSATSLAWMGSLVGFMATSWLACRAVGYRGAGVVFAAQTAMATLLGLTFSKGVFGVIASQGVAVVATSPLAMCFAIIFVSFSFFALFLQQFALQKGRSIVVVPIISTLQVALPVPTGIWVFHESAQQIQLFGIVLLIASVGFLSIRRSPSPPKNCKKTS